MQKTHAVHSETLSARVSRHLWQSKVCHNSFLLWKVWTDCGYNIALCLQFDAASGDKPTMATILG